MKIHRLVLCGLLGVCASARADFVGSDDFSASSMDSGAWSVVQEQGGASFSQTGTGVLNYQVGSATGNDATAWAWIAGNAPFSSDWSIQLDVSNPVMLTGGGAQYVNVGVGVRDAADINNNGYSVRLDTTYHSSTDSQVTSWESDKESTGGTVIESHATAVTVGAVLISWTATTHTLTAAFDEDGAAGGYNWVKLSSYDPTVSDAWNMSSGDSFLIVLTGSSINTDGSNSTGLDQVHVDNFAAIASAATISTVPEPADSAEVAECAALLFALIGARRRKSRRASEGRPPVSGG